MSNNVDKIVPSKLEKAMYAFLYKYVGDKLPPKVTPNQITLVGAICGLIGIICGFLAGVSKFFLIGTVLGIMGHLVCDDLDGYIARKRNMSSLAGGYFDLLTDILHITYLIIALSYAGVVQFKIAIWMVPVYALIIFTSMNSILYLKKFPFPRLGPIETHLFFQAICILEYRSGNTEQPEHPSRCGMMSKHGLLPSQKLCKALPNSQPLQKASFQQEHPLQSYRRISGP